MGITRTGVRCPWCARPVGDGSDRPEVCPSCGVPLAPVSFTSGRPIDWAIPAARARRAQRLRASAALLALTSVILALAAVPIAVSAMATDHGDGRAQNNLIAVLRAAEKVKRETGTFAGAQPVVLAAGVFGIRVLDGLEPSRGPAEVSTVIAGDGWYGAAQSASGRCYGAATISGDPQMLRSLLVGNCTGDAARAALAPLDPPSVARSSGP